MIDYFFKFNTEAAAIADAAGSQFYNANTGWNSDRVAPGLLVWRASQDVNGTDAQGNPTVTHTPLAGWFGCISLDHVNNTLLNHANLQLAIDRDLSAAGQVAILKSNLTTAVLQDIRFSPLFAGSNYPFGNLK